MEIGMGSCGSALNIDNENNMIILQVILLACNELLCPVFQFRLPQSEKALIIIKGIDSRLRTQTICRIQLKVKGNYRIIR